MFLLKIFFCWLFGLPGVALLLAACPCLPGVSQPEGFAWAALALTGSALGASLLLAAIRKGG
jgi:hypothetical protein